MSFLKPRPAVKQGHCPRCGNPTFERVARFGFIQVHLMPFFGRYPWRCAVCGRIEYRSDRT